MADMLSRARVRGAVQHRFVLRGAFGMDVEPDESYACLYLVQDGALEVCTDDCSTSVSAGSVVLVRPGRTHAVVSERGAERVSARDFVDACQGDRCLTMHHGEGEVSADLIAGFLQLPTLAADPISQGLPTFLVGRSDKHLGSASKALSEELDQGTERVAAVVSRLAEILYIRTLQCWVRGGCDGAPPGVFRALTDAPIAVALQCLHSRPTHSWTVAELASEVGVSRTVLATRFSDRMGVGPLTYLRRHRVHLASQRLLETSDSVAHIAEEVGYQSSAAFCRAFASEVGETPGTFRRRHRPTR